MKTKLKYTYFILFALIISMQARNQEMANADVKSWQLKSYAKSAERSGDVFTAIDYYEAYSERHPGDLKIAREMAELYREARDYENAGFNYLKTYHLNIDKYVQSLYYYALMEKMQGNYERAIENFEKFLFQYKNEKDSRQYKKLAKNEIEGCQLALQLFETKKREMVVITHLNNTINKAHVEMSPTFIDENNIIYASLPADGIEYYPADDTSSWPVRQFFTAKKQDDSWFGGNKLEGPFNIDGINTANGAFSPDGLRFYFNRCEKNWQSKIICHIYVSYKIEEEWQEAFKLSEPINIPNYTSTQPSIGRTWKKNKEVIYFASDRPEGKGGMDIWYTLFDTLEYTFTEPKELSRKINSTQDEITPYYDNERKILYYSSNGRPGVGGFDIFQAEGQESKFTDAVNKGYPYNSPADDFYFVVSPSENEGLMVSNRIGGTSLLSETCCDDIYSFYIPNYIHYSVQGILEEDEENILQQYISMQSISIEKEMEERKQYSPARLENVEAILYSIDKSTMVTLLINKTRTNHAGEYKFTLTADKNYKLILNENGIFLKEFEFSTFDPENPEVTLDTAALVIMPDKPLGIENIYYAFDRSVLTEVAKSSIDTTLFRILSKIPKIIAEVSSHTDNKGNDSYNMRLSQSRAESCVSYLVSKGISADRLIAKGYGETRPLVANTFQDGSDNPEGREKNRRTEFRIIGRVGDHYEQHIIIDTD